MNDLKYARERTGSLRKALNHHSYRYYILDSPEIGDEEYDRLFAELKALEQEYPQTSYPFMSESRPGEILVGFNHVMSGWERVRAELFRIHEETLLTVRKGLHPV